MSFEIHQWEKIAEKYTGTLLLGNGASIAISPSFSYVSLLQHARDRELLAESIDRLFAAFGTSDFELVLRIVWQASHVNRALDIKDGQTYAAYVAVRDSLINIVRDVHPEHHQVTHVLPQTYRFLSQFETVVSLNYDLLVYWTMTYGLGLNNAHAFKDCFINQRFEDDWRRLRVPIGRKTSTTLVFYLHGSLILCRNRSEQELKIHNRGDQLLGQILQSWQSETFVPLFVSEGTSEQKIAAIHNSYYLSTVYREVLTSEQRSLVVYGWGFGDQDIHLLRKMRQAGLATVAVSIFRANQADCHRAYQCIHDALGPEVVVEFFDSESPGCWLHANQ